MGTIVLNPPETQAGGPLVVNPNGTTGKWDTAGSLTFNPDGGGLGKWNNATAVLNVTEAFDRWGPDLPTSILIFSNVGPIPGDGDVDTVAEFFPLYTYCTDDGINPVIFDDDGSLFSAFGLPSSVIAIAGPCVHPITGDIYDGFAAFNGKWFDNNLANGELTEDEFKGTLVHEFGHWLNLDHSQTNGNYFRLDTDPGFSEFIPIFGPPPLSSVSVMFPFAIGGSSIPVMDDIAAISRLYPAGGFGSSTGSIKGTIFESNGTTPVKGANVIARNVLDPYNDAVSNVSGKPFDSPTSDGEYELPGLTDLANYSVEVVNVDPDFDGGSSVGPLDPPVPIPGDEEFYNGVNEANTNPPDIISVYSSVSSVGGTSETSIDIIINGPTADLSLLMDDSPDSVSQGSTLTYTIDVYNNTGPGHAQGVMVTDILPPDVTYNSATASQGSCTEETIEMVTTVTCDLGELLIGGSATVTITVIPTVVGLLSNTASISADQTDPDTMNNSDTRETTVNPPSADLFISKTDSPDPVSVDGVLVYEIGVSNLGPDAATVVTVTDTLDLAMVEYLSVTPSQGMCSGPDLDGKVSCILGDLASLSSAMVTISVKPIAEGIINNTADVVGNENDPIMGNNSVTTSTEAKIPLYSLASSSISGGGGGAGSSSSYLMGLGVSGQGFTGSAGSSNFQLEAGFVPGAAEN